MKQQVLSCAFTGHRPGKLPWKTNESDPGCVWLKETLTRQIKRLVKDGCTDFFSGAAEGVDSWCALIVLDMIKTYPAVKLHCILPYKGQAEEWTAFSQIQYRYILEKADSIKWVTREFTKDCYEKRNHQMIDQADALLAVCDGRPRSGATATLHYAVRQNKIVWNINPRTREIQRLTGN